MSDVLSWVFAVLFVLVVIAWYLTYTAARLDRLHVRLTGTLAALDAQLVRRAEASLELAHSGLLDGATSLILATAAAESLENPGEHGEIREAVENDLTEALHVSVTEEVGETLHEDGPLGVDHLARLRSACMRVQLARRFHNDAVTDVRRVRRKWVVRLFRLAGHTPMPRTVEFDDEMPPGLVA
ncbi:hypothetical protein OO014_00370 [Intrasporangium calvum]|uniref:NUDIX hydrolase n=1 Tax=Intrasporangium calvum TaxID=53358 RepID=A0ABT5GBW5_9MICO|nr:hypothetical protein [Intrasporangium calvum]MDC5695698.1 hypothetical protein [Intrasporangium calvum]